MDKKNIIAFLRKYKEQNKEKYHIIKIGIFGSSARDELNENSDVDIVVELEKPEMFTMVGIKQELEESFHMPVDIVRYRDNMNDFLKNRIDQEAIYV